MVVHLRGFAHKTLLEDCALKYASRFGYHEHFDAVVITFPWLWAQDCAVERKGHVFLGCAKDNFYFYLF